MSNKLSDKSVIIIAAAMLAVILIGEVVVYTSDYTDYSAEASRDGNVISYNISADGSKSYSVVISETGGYSRVQKILLYYDEGYPSDCQKVEADVGAPALNQSYHLKQIKALLGFRDILDIQYVDANELRDEMQDAIANNKSSGMGLICISGVLPDTVYAGLEDDTIFKWLDNGGSLYWAGNLIGCKYGTSEGSLIEVEDYQRLFFGSDCLNTNLDVERAHEEYSGNGYREALSLSNNNVKYAVRPASVEGRSILGLGYEKDGYASITATQYGSGAIFVFGGDYSDYQRYDMAQVIAAGIGPWSELKECPTGTVTRGTMSGSIVVNGGSLSAYIYLGGYYPVYGKYFRL